MSTKNVLIVDDSRVSRMMIKAFMSAARPDWTLHEANSGDEALTLVETQAFELVTMDINMPGMNGLAAAEQIHRSHPQTIITMLSANVQEASRTKASEIGVFFVEKPISEATVNRIIALAEEAQT